MVDTTVLGVWHGLHLHPTSTQLRWFGMSWTADWWKSSQQVLSICEISFKTVGKAFLMELVERMPRVCKAVIKAKGGYFEEPQIYNVLFSTFLVTTWFHMYYLIVLTSSLLFYNVVNSKNKEKTLEWVGVSKHLTSTVCIYIFTLRTVCNVVSSSSSL